MRHFLIGILLFATSSISATVYHKDILQTMATAMDIDSKLNARDDGLYWHAFEYKGAPITIIIRNQKVEHIGYSFFTPHQRQLIGKDNIVNFLERYMLECCLPIKRPYSVATKMIEDHFDFREGSLKTVTKLANDTTLNFMAENRFGKTLLVRWADKDNVICEISFPVDHNLIRGTEIQEDERHIVEDIKQSKIHAPLLPSNLTTDDMKTSLATGHYVQQGEIYYTEQLNTNKYYRKDDRGELVLINDIRYPLETLSNLLTTTDLPNQFNIQIRLKKYGLKEEILTVPLNQLTSYMIDEGCKIFFGVIEFDDHKAVCEVVYKNDETGYHHVMKIEADIEDLRTGNGQITSRLTPFISTSSIMYLFDELKK